MLAGGYRERTRAETRACPARCAVLHPAGESHADRFDDRPARLLSLELDRPPEDIVGDAFARPSLLSGAPVERLARVLRRELHAPDDLSASVVESALLELAVDALRATRDGGRRPAWLAAADAWLRERLDRPVGLAELSATLGLPRATVARGFRRHLGRSVGERGREMRVERALALLPSRLGLAEIAHACGFADQSHMTRCVRRVAGAPPGRLRLSGASRSSG